MKINTKALIVLPITFLITLAIQAKAQTTNSTRGQPVPYAVPPLGGFPKTVIEQKAPPTTASQVTDGIWLPLTNQAPDTIHFMLLLSDGTVMAKGFAGGGGIGNAWYRLTPDANGSYVNGTWSTLTPMNDTRLYFSSQVLKDGRVFVAGGEYPRDISHGIVGRATAEIYDPIANSWTRIDPPTSVLDPSMFSPVFPNQYYQAFVDSVSEILPDGRVLVAPVSPKGSSL